MTNSFATSDGCVLDYTLHAGKHVDAPRLVLLHSLALDRSIWDSVARQLAGEAHILAYDCRGHGKSDKPTGPYSLAQFAGDLAELLDHLEWPSAVVGGCSMGGCVTQAFGGLYPTRTSGLALIDTTAWYGAEAPQQWRERAANAQAKGLGGLIDFQVTRWFGDTFRAEHPDLVQAVTRVFLANELEAYASTCIMLGDADVRPFLASMRMPVAVIVGEEDYATPVAMARQIHQSVTGSTLTILPSARHLSPIESPSEIASELRALFARLKG